MSSEAVGWVFRHSPFSGAAFTVHLAIADSVNDQNENEFFMAQANLCTKARLKTRAVRDAVAALEGDGFITPADDRFADAEARAKAGVPTRWVFEYVDDVPVVFESRRRNRNTTPAKSAGVSESAPRHLTPEPRHDVPTSPAPRADVTQEEPNEPKSSSAKRARTRRDDYWDALCEGFGDPQSPSSKSNFGKVVNALVRMGTTPEVVAARARWVFENREGATVNAVLSSWEAAGTALARQHPRTHHDRIAEFDRTGVMPDGGEEPPEHEPTVYDRQAEQYRERTERSA